MDRVLELAARAVCGLTLACSLVPAAALASVQERAEDACTQEERARQIDEHAHAHSDGAILVVPKSGAEHAGRTGSGASAQSAGAFGISGASAELLSPSSGMEGGGATYHVSVPEGMSVGQAVAAAERNPGVAHAQPIFKYRLLDGPASGGNASALAAVSADPREVPNDEFLKDKTNSGSSPNAWWIYSVRAPEAWDIAHSDNKVAVAVLDTGINFEHEDLKDNILADYAWDSYLQMPLKDAPTAQQTSTMAHGSHVAGIVAARANNSAGTAGVSYNANILPICVFHEVESAFGSDAACDDEDLIRAYDYLMSDPDGDGRTIAQETNTRVVNMSLGGYLADDPEYEYDYAFEEKIEQAQDAGILTVAAAGNGDGYGNPRTDESYPSDYEAVMSVIALQTDNQRAYWSDKNEHKNISAPGVDIYSTWYTGNQYHFDSGTSMASPLVAGGAALLWAYNPELSVADVKEALYTTADDLGASGFDSDYGWGRMNLEGALKSLGTVMVRAERAQMPRTTSQRFTAQPIADAGGRHTWNWSVSDESKARIDADGELTALSAGSVEVRVQAADNEGLSGKKTIEITEIAIEGGIAASASPGENCVSVRWNAADGATEYRVERARSESGPFAQLAVLPAGRAPTGAAGEDGFTYVDATARPSIEYWYRVIPVGTLDGQPVRGEPSNAARCYYADKTALKRAIERAEALLGQTKASDDGADVPCGEHWSTYEARYELNVQLRAAYIAYYSGSMRQEGVDAAAEGIAGACEGFESARSLGLMQPDPSPGSQDGAAPGREPGPDAGGDAPLAASDAIVPDAGKGAGGGEGARADVADRTPASDARMTAESAATAGRMANTLAVRAKHVKVKHAKVKRAKRVIAAGRAFEVRGAQGEVAFEKIWGAKKVSVSKGGKVSVGKGCKPGVYKARVRVTAWGTAEYKPKSTAVTLKVTVLGRK